MVKVIKNNYVASNLSEIVEVASDSLSSQKWREISRKFGGNLVLK
jgi:hypothetical protein